jgi:hypothetical protein
MIGTEEYDRVITMEEVEEVEEVGEGEKGLGEIG